MKKLFADPHYNVMDGLDTYIDDYSTPDPIPKAMLRQMVQARMLGLLDDELEEQPQPVDVVASDAAASPQASRRAGAGDRARAGDRSRARECRRANGRDRAAPGSADADRDARLAAADWR